MKAMQAMKIRAANGVTNNGLTIRLVVSLLLVALFAWPVIGVIGSAANDTTFSGQATVVKGTVAGVPITLADTGPIAPEGGTLKENLLCYPGANCDINVPDLTNGALRAEVLHAAVVAQGHKSSAEATVAEFGLNAAGQSVSAEFLSAEAEAECQAGTAFVSGNAEIVNLVINGMPIVVSGEVNQTVALPAVGGVVIINEQTGTGASANRGDITVNALHIKIPGPVPGTDTDLIVASAHADITCATPRTCPADKDFVTGGGWIIAPSSAKGTFAVAGGIKNSNFWGHLTYIDHGTPRLRVKGTGVTAYGPGRFGPTSRHIEGTCEINGVAGTYKVDVSDMGQPGRDDDFELTLSTGYYAYGKLAGGNIKLHTCK